MCATVFREAKVHCANIIQDAEATCARTIREVETATTEHTCTLQEACRDGMEGLEKEAIEEEEQDHQSFLAICGAALQICPLGTCGVLMYPLQLLTVNMSFATLLAIPLQASITREEPTPVISCLATPAAPVPSSEMKWWHHLPEPIVCLPQPADEVAETFGELPHQKWKDRTPLKKLLKGVW